jgi:hypothetical protein
MKPPTNPSQTTLFLYQVYTKFKSLPPFDTRLHRLMLDIEREQDKVGMRKPALGFGTLSFSADP